MADVHICFHGTDYFSFESALDVKYNYIPRRNEIPDNVRSTCHDHTLDNDS